jgi:hypothetical protein
VTPFTPKTSGIPPNALLLNKLEAIDQKILIFPQTIVEGVRHELQNLRQVMKDELDSRNIGGPDFGAKRIVEQMVEQTAEMIDDFRTELKTQKVSRDAIADEDDFYGTGTGNADFGDAQSNPSKKKKVSVLDWQTHHGAGKKRFMLAPDGYKLPQLTLSTLILTWFCGDKVNNISPFRMLSGKDIPAMKRGTSILSMMKKLMSHVERAAVEVALEKSYCSLMLFYILYSTSTYK